MVYIPVSTKYYSNQSVAHHQDLNSDIKTWKVP